MSKTSHTHSKQISTFTFRRNLLYVPLKESFLLSMPKDPQLKVTQSFPTISIYKAQILFIDGQVISNYFFILWRIVFFYNKENLFLSHQRNLIVKPKSKQEFEIISNTLNLQGICILLDIHSQKRRRAIHSQRRRRAS